MLGDKWSNVNLDKKPFEMRGSGDNWKIPDHGILELDYVPCDAPTGRRSKYELDLSDPMERSTVERLWQVLVIIEFFWCFSLLERLNQDTRLLFCMPLTWIFCIDQCRGCGILR